MGKYLDKTGLQYFYNKLKDKFADKSALDSLTGAMQWKGQLSTLPTDLSTYSAGNVISVDNKEYVCTEVDGTKSWIELGDEGSYLLKTAAESTYLKKAAGEVKTDNLADDSVTKAKLDDSVQTSLGKADNSLQIGETNTQSNQTVITTESTENYNNGLKVQNSSNGTEITPTGITFGLNTQPIGIYRKGTYELKLNSATGSSLTLSGVAAPVNNTDAVNKKYVDTSVSSKVDKDNITTSLKAVVIDTTNADSGEQNLANLHAYEENLKKLGVDISSDSPIIPVVDQVGYTGFVQYFSVDGKYVGLINYTEGTDAFIISIDYQGVCSIEELLFTSSHSFTSLEDDVFELQTSVTNLGDDVKLKPDKSTLATSLQAITIYTDNTAEHKAANLANIKAYEDNLKALGVDVTKGYKMPVVCSPSTYCGVLFSRGNNYFDGYASVHNSLLPLAIKVDAAGEFASTDIVATATTFNNLTTTSKTVIGAINEVNSAKITGVKINGETKRPTSGVIDLGTISGGSGSTKQWVFSDNTTTLDGIDIFDVLTNYGYDITSTPNIVFIDVNHQALPLNNVSKVRDGVYELYFCGIQNFTADIEFADNSCISAAIIKLTKNENNTSIDILNENRMSLSDVIKEVATSGTTDTAMSDSSTNPVQNKVIKSYVDGLVGDAITQLSEI